MLLRIESLTVRLAVIAAVCIPPAAGRAQPERQVVEPRLVHLRSGEIREWSSFPAQSQGDHLELPFSATKNVGEWALHLRQQDIKQAWRVLINNKPLGELVKEETDQILYLRIPPEALTDGDNILRIEP